MKFEQRFRGAPRLDLPAFELARKPQPVLALPGRYRLQGLIVFRPVKDEHPGFHGLRGELLSAAGKPEELYLCGAPPTDETGMRFDRGVLRNYIEQTQLDSREFQDEGLTFEARAYQPNEWSLGIPKEIVKDVEETLKEPGKP